MTGLSRAGRPDYPPEELEPWEVKTRKRRQRIRKPTLASALKQARQAGMLPTGATVTADGVALEFGNANAKSADASATANEWDSVLQ